MRTKNFIIILCCVVLTSFIFIILGPAGQQNDSIKNIVTQTHQQLRELQENLRASDEKTLEVDEKYLAHLGFIQPTFNGTKSNFSIVTYVQDGQAPSVILLSQNIAAKFPNEYLLIYDLGLSEDDSHALNSYCNSSKCSVIIYDLSVYPSYLMDQRMHAYRPLVIKDALQRSKQILFTENYIRYRGTSRDLHDLKLKSLQNGGILGWTTPLAVSTLTHPKMFGYFQTNAENFQFSRMINLDAIFITDTPIVNEKILLPWIKCCLTMECIDPIGAQSGGCKYNKKPQFRYSGCHAYDTSALNIVLGLTWHDETKYSLSGDTNTIFYQETLEQATKILENKRRNSSDTSEHPFTDE
ncbi:uncharacterized protein LOC129607420 [Condylostylus longicornis]|uniref:uncharacterized protein LOC129607420 n=1 Tax=Condylostylus longicornis TaxID=2530218 RepID=UPI00244E0A8A|nr:uncharacterized protein LOC129607420 [Condylostylus longicornis]